MTISYKKRRWIAETLCHPTRKQMLRCPQVLYKTFERVNRMYCDACMALHKNPEDKTAQRVKTECEEIINILGLTFDYYEEGE